jgi:hypothetical protein
VRIMVMRSLPVTHTHNIFVDKGPPRFLLFHHEISARLPRQRMLVIYFGVITLLSDGCSRFVCLIM